MARDNIATYEMTNAEIAQEVDRVLSSYKSTRVKWERSWHDNNFFDDGFHYRFISPETYQVIDYSDTNSYYSPRRAIPKASRQIRGIVNLLLANRPTPVVYPEKLLREMFGDGPLAEQRYLARRKESAKTARRVSHWLINQWEENELINLKLPFMMLLAAKHGPAYMKIWPDANREKILTTVRDAFDIWVDGTLDSIYDSPVLIETYPMFVNDAKNNSDFDEEMRQKIIADNKESASDIKQAYVKSRHGGSNSRAGQTGTVLIKEAYLKEEINKKIISKIKKQPDSNLILNNFSEGDQIIRHVVTGSNQVLRDVYTNFTEYPFVDFRYEPGPIYQTPFLDRFKHSNKSLDNTVSRIEQWIYTMASGKWWRREGENWEVDNTPGGQIVTSATPPQQLPMGNMSPALFNYIELLTSYIEEQGVTTTALGKLPNDVKSGVAIESLKSSEYANLTIALEMVKRTVGRIAEKMLDIANDYIITTQTVSFLNQGNPEFFDVIGQRGVDLHKEMKQEELLQGVVPLKRDYRVKIEIESGLGYTMEGKRANAIRLADYMLNLAQIGLVPPEVMKEIVKRLMETFQFGGMAEILEGLDKWDQGARLTNEQIQAMKVALAETMKDTGLVGPQQEQQQVETTKVGVAEALKDLSEGGE